MESELSCFHPFDKAETPRKTRCPKFPFEPYFAYFLGESKHTYHLHGNNYVRICFPGAEIRNTITITISYLYSPGRNSIYVIVCSAVQLPHQLSDAEDSDTGIHLCDMVDYDYDFVFVFFRADYGLGLRLRLRKVLFRNTFRNFRC